MAVTRRRKSKAQPAEASPFATVKEACAYLRFSRKTVEDLLRDGTISAGKPNGRWRIPWANLERYAKSK